MCYTITGPISVRWDRPRVYSYASAWGSYEEPNSVQSSAPKDGIGGFEARDYGGCCVLEPRMNAPTFPHAREGGIAIGQGSLAAMAVKIPTGIAEMIRRGCGNTLSIGLTIRCSKVANYFKSTTYKYPGSVLTNQLTNRTSK